MASRFDASGDSFSRTTDLPSITSFTAMGWFYFSTDRNATANMIAFGKTSGADYLQLGNDQATGSGQLFMWDGANSGTGSSLTTATWYHFCLTCAGFGAGNERNGYLNGVLDVQITAANGSFTPTAGKLWIANDNDTEWMNGRAAAIKIWSGAILTADEILNEMRQYRPIRTTNLHGFWPCLSIADDEIDYSGNGRSWTVGGTLATEDGPPIAWNSAIRRRVHIVSGGGGGGAVPMLTLLGVG